jgi:hypothetical protein
VLRDTCLGPCIGAVACDSSGEDGVWPEHVLYVTEELGGAAGKCRQVSRSCGVSETQTSFAEYHLADDCISDNWVPETSVQNVGRELPRAVSRSCHAFADAGTTGIGTTQVVSPSPTQGA